MTRGRTRASLLVLLVAGAAGRAGRGRLALEDGDVAPGFDRRPGGRVLRGNLVPVWALRVDRHRVLRDDGIQPGVRDQVLRRTEAPTGHQGHGDLLGSAREEDRHPRPRVDVLAGRRIGARDLPDIDGVARLLLRPRGLETEVE